MHVPDAGPAPAAAVPPVVSHRRMLVLAVPMMISHATTPLLGLADATVVGRLGDAALLGGVALGAVAFDMIFWAFGGLRLATAGLTAQAVGAGARTETDVVLARGLLLALVLGLTLLVLQGPLAAGTFAIAGASPQVNAALSDYFDIRIWGAPATLANYVILGATLGRARADLGLLLQAGINLANIVLSVAMVMGLGLGVPGVALATVASDVLGVGFGVFVLGRLGARPFSVPREAVLRRQALVATLAVNRDIFVRNTSLMAAFVIFQALGARSGDVTLAANAVLYNLFLVASYLLDGFATAAEALCGQALGARDRPAFRRAARLALGWSLGTGAVVAALCYAGGLAFIAFVSTNAEVRAAAAAFLPFAALTPLVGAAAFAYDGIFIGATWSAAMRNLMLLALAVFVLVAASSTILGNTGLWLAMLAFLGSRGLLQALAYPGLERRAFAQAEPMKMPAMSTSTPPTTT